MVNFWPKTHYFCTKNTLQQLPSHSCCELLVRTFSSSWPEIPPGDDVSSSGPLDWGQKPPSQVAATSSQRMNFCVSECFFILHMCTKCAQFVFAPGDDVAKCVHIKNTSKWPLFYVCKSIQIFSEELPPNIKKHKYACFDLNSSLYPQDRYTRHFDPPKP